MTQEVNGRTQVPCLLVPAQGPDTHDALLRFLAGTWGSQGGGLCHLPRSLCILHLGVEETLPLAFCRSPYRPTAFSLCPPMAWLAHRHIHKYTQNCRCLGQQTTGETTSPLLTLEGGRGTGKELAQFSPPASAPTVISPPSSGYLNL